MPLTAKEFIDLKDQIKTELKRRSGCGPVNQFSGNAYNFQTVPEAGGVILEEQGHKTIDIALTVTDINGFKYPQAGDYIPAALDNLDQLITQWSNEQAVPNASSSCRGACTGLCTNACYSGATGCGGCDISCGTTCGGCANTCTESCGSNCSATCGRTCTGYCYGGCSGKCTGACTGCTGGSS